MVSLSEDIVPAVEEAERDLTLALGREMRIAALRDHEALRILREALAEAEAAMADMIGDNILHSGKAVNQRQLDYTRGYYDGARHWLTGRIALAEQRVARAEQREAADPRPAGRIDPRTGERVEGVGQE